jgi:ubiquinone biosynthesis protein
MSGAFRNARRLLKIARILARHDALFLLEKLEVAPAVVTAARLISRKRVKGRPGRRLAKAFQEAGPSFIKLGQALSTRSDLLGEELTADLSELQDSLAPFSGAEARAAIEAEFGKSVDDLFSEFDDKAVAAASIAQVHFAVTKDGRDVAVKILRPGVEAAFQADLDLFTWVAGLIEKTRPELRRLKPVQSIKTVADTVAMEMDLRFEAAAAAELGENFKNDETFNVPTIDWALTGRRIMTAERMGGIPMDDRDAVLKAGFDPEEVVKKASRAFFMQVFRDGFFHADLHPGNLFIDKNGNIAAVDFGIMGRMDRRTKRHLGEMLLGFLTRDYARASRVHFEAGWVPADQSVDLFTQACRSIAEPILDRPQNEISIARLLGQLFGITETFQMEAQPQLLLLQKTMLVAEGTARTLCPEANMWLLIRPLVEEWMEKTLAPENLIAETLDEATTTLRRLPTIIEGLEKSVTQVTQGGLKLDPDTVRAMVGDKSHGPSIPLWVIAALLAGLLLIQIL